MHTKFTFQVAALSKSNDVDSIGDVIHKLYNGHYKEHPALYDLLQRNEYEHAVQLVSIILKEVNYAPKTSDTIPFRTKICLKILEDMIKVSRKSIDCVCSPNIFILF